jgi:hypothetical protein
MFCTKTVAAFQSTGRRDPPPWGHPRPIVAHTGISRPAREPMVEACCITTAEGDQRAQCYAQGWGGSPHHYPGMRPSGFGLCLTMATHCDHATNMSITSQHVSIVERRRLYAICRGAGAESSVRSGMKASQEKLLHQHIAESCMPVEVPWHCMRWPGSALQPPF